MNELQKHLEKLSNQARFVQMIIDGDLVISKKKKNVLVNELKENAFRPFPKVAEAVKAGEDEPAVEEEESDSSDTLSNAYDYLLGMPIWSLTQERVERLRRQIGDKEVGPVRVLVDSEMKASVVGDLSSRVRRAINVEEKTTFRPTARNTL